MAFDDTFKPRVNFDEIQVFQLTGQARTVRELQPSHFAGPIAEWAHEREQDFGDTIISRHVYAEVKGGKMHRVAWLYHEGVDFEDGEPFCRHHIGCDCLLESQRLGEPDLMFSCESLLSVLNKRAWFVNATYGTEAVMRQIPHLPAEALFGVPRPALEKAFSIATIGYILEHDARHPESWVGTIMDREHQATLLALVLQQDPDEVREHAETMESVGTIEFDGETMRLSEDEREKIEQDMANRSIIERFEEEFRKLD
jgi:hypothetical protein